MEVKQIPHCNTSHILHAKWRIYEMMGVWPGSSPETDKCAWRLLEENSKNPFAYSKGGQKLQQLRKEVREIRFLCMKWKLKDKPLAFIHTWATVKHGREGTTVNAYS